MKTLKFTIYILLISIVVPFHLVAQNQEVPVTTSSKEALDLFMKGRNQLENIENVAATALFEQAIQKDPNFARAYLYRAQSGGGFNVFRQNLDKAVSLLDKVSEGEKYEILCVQAQADGNGVKEKEYLDWLVTNFPSDKRIQAQAGSYYYGISDYSKALSHFKKATELDKNYAPAYNMLGYCQSALNNYPEAEKAFQTYIKLIPNSANPIDSYAELLLKMGKYDESIAQYKMAVEKDPVNFALSLAGVGHNYIFKGDYPSARKYYQQYFDKATLPGSKLNALYWEAVSYLYENKVDEAVKTFDESRALAEKENMAPTAINSYANQGFILTETGNPKEGMKHYENAIDLIGKSKFSKADVDNFMTQAALWKFYTLTAQGDYEKAKVEADKAKQTIESRKNHGEEMFLNSLLGYSALKQGNYDEAIQYYSKADAEDPLNWYYQAMAYQKMGDTQKASKLMEKIKTSNVNSMNLALVRNKTLGSLAMEESKP
ncbi:MAG TPA: tetratricopeptide repeat protein [Prolixibacteraceae bacterium]|nr:tetratricopeptide repeat protein [Prolixibacteraceae bacterium]